MAPVLKFLNCLQLPTCILCFLLSFHFFFCVFDVECYLLCAMQYVMEEINVKTVTPCNDPLMYASLRAEPNFRYD